MAYPMPTAVIVQNLIADLLDKKIAVQKCEPLEIKPLPVVAVAAYEADKDDNKLAALCICNMEFASRIAAALTMIPENIATESIKNGKLADVLDENFLEVMNVATTLFYNASSPHVKFKTLYFSNEELPREVLRLVRRPAGRIDLEINIERYGPGMISLMINK